MLSGAVHGYRGLVKEIVARVSAEAFPRKKPLLVATGGDAELIAGSVKIFDAVDPLLTLRGLLTIAERNL
jgi:type III pantothenate kinase